jgi:hypothetical protein
MERKAVIAWTEAASSALSRGGARRAQRQRLSAIDKLLPELPSGRRAASEAILNGPVIHFGTALALALLTSSALTACGVQPAKDFSGPWHPINRFQSQATKIPLKQAYTFYAAPMDETLKTMLGRWTKDTGRTLSYGLSYDITLHKPVAAIHTPDIESAAQQLSKIFAPQGVLVTAHPREIVVQAATAADQRPLAEPTASGAKERVRQ